MMSSIRDYGFGPRIVDREIFVQGDIVHLRSNSGLEIIIIVKNGLSHGVFATDNKLYKFNDFKFTKVSLEELVGFLNQKYLREFSEKHKKK